MKSDTSANPTKDDLCAQFIGREERMLALVRRYFTIEDLLAVRARLIGSGFIGGKAVGMLLSRAILKADRDGWKSVKQVKRSLDNSLHGAVHGYF